MIENVFKDLYTIGQTVGKFGTVGTLTSILGQPSSWFGGPHPEISLFQRFDTGAQTLSGMVFQRVFPMREMSNSIVQDKVEEYADEAWFFINGITTNIPMLKLNGAYLFDLFKRPFELVYNPTDGIVIDLVECLLGRTFNAASEPCDYLTRRITDVLNYDGYRKVVLIAHSQGCIIASNVVKSILQKLTGDARLTKLEIYTFGCAADEMDADEALSIEQERLVPYIEHYANLGDLVANVGILQKRKMQELGREYYGEIYELDQPGHYLNAHYLNGLAGRSYSSQRLGQQSRLYGYLEGGRPTYFNPLPASLSG